MARTGTVYRWYVVILLLAVFILSYFDRFILSLLVEPLKASLKLSDFEVGLLLGPAFSTFHVLVAIPLGWYADRSNRKWLLFAGIVIWCSMTVGSGLVATFLPLFLMRLGLGLGEAVVSPCSVSMISDYFNRRERARAISVYMAGPYLGAGLAFLVGGAVVGYLTKVGHVTWPIFGTLAPWQATFVLVGIPGFLFAGLMLSVKEPKRQETLAARPSITGAFRYIGARWRGFGALIVGSTCNFALSALTLWNVPLFSRVWGWSVMETGFVTGLFYFTAGPIGTALAVWSARHFAGRIDGSMRVLILGLLICVPASALYPVMPTAEMGVALMFIAFIGKSVATAGGPASMAQVTPGEMRTQGLAIFNTFISLIGPLLGPPIIGAATDFTGDPKKIGVVLCFYVLLIGIPSILIAIFGLKHYRAAVLDLESALAEAQPPARD
ncbi:MFS transporter [Sphingomonas sp. HITSZ_GF]|uniref:MFS transporter n=1 Tax=Sphingomonas sp. HITSZ_GF TaxID=3037247 RepID=UPI00240D6770|nr:MFS transporter [Sphingomonas sp. HITSZ_GF]